MVAQLHFGMPRENLLANGDRRESQSRLLMGQTGAVASESQRLIHPTKTRHLPNAPLAVVGTLIAVGTLRLRNNP
jgi:hypothetical protein